MKRIVLFILLSIASIAYAAKPVHEGKVVGVIDGDTIVVLTASKQQIKVRLAEIDAPEQSQAFGQRSKQSLSDLVFSKQVRVDQQDIDRYGRVVGRVFVEGLDINAEQIRRGFAWVYRQYVRDRSLFKLEEKAKSEKVGLWADSNPIPPWEYRHGGQPKQTANKKTNDVIKARSNSPATVTTSKFICGAKRKCGEMTSCEEAKFYLTKCGLTRLDGNHDGVPCETLCR